MKFLSDLCGREDSSDDYAGWEFFLSDLCGREARFIAIVVALQFLSDLCGREVMLNYLRIKALISKRPVRS